MKRSKIAMLFLLSFLFLASDCEHACYTLVSIKNPCNISYKFELYQTVSGNQKLVFQGESNKDLLVLRHKKEKKTKIIYIINGKDQSRISIIPSMMNNAAFKLIIINSDTVSHEINFSNDSIRTSIRLCE